jgi:CO/xanthine dehydrogenase Mo-binding subunit
MSVRIRLRHHSAEGRRRPPACQAITATLTPVEKLVGLTGADTGRVDVLGHLVVQDVGRAINPAAVANAIADAAGARFTDLPITGEAIRAARRSGPLP